MAAGGSAGAITRVALSRALPAHAGAWPWATFAVNVAGTSLLAYAATRLLERLPPSTYRRPALGTGFCGALTTFSTLQLELVGLLRAHRFALAVLYAAASLTAGLLAVLLASRLVRRARLVYAG